MTHGHHWPAPLDCVEVGGRVCLTEVPDGYLMGVQYPNDDKRIVGHVTVGPGGWTRSGSLAGGDLTLRPSLVQDYSPVGRVHGWVTDGKWRDA